MVLFPVGKCINGLDWSIISDIYVAPIVATAPDPDPGLAPGTLTNMTDITQSVKDMAQHSLDTEAMDYLKKQIIFKNPKINVSSRVILRSSRTILLLRLEMLQIQNYRWITSNSWKIRRHFSFTTMEQPSKCWNFNTKNCMIDFINKNKNE